MSKKMTTLKQVEIEKLKIFFSLMPAAALGHYFAAIFIAMTLRPQVQIVNLSLWLSAATILFVLKTALIILYKKQKTKITNYLLNWHIIIIACSAFCGALWGVGGFYFYTTVTESYQVLVVATILGLAFISFAILMHNSAGFYVFYSLVVLPLIVSTLFSGQQEDYYLALLLSIFYVACIIYAFRFFKKNDYRIALKHLLFQKNKKIRLINESKSQFLAAASHDLRQPLQALGFYIVLLSNYLREPQKKSLFDKTLGAYQALENLLNQLLNVSKINANLINIDESNFSLASIFEKLKDEYTLRAEKKGLLLKFSYSDLFIYSDAVAVERILRNLTENALRYTEKGFIEISAKPVGLKLKIEILDTGIGIAQDDLTKIFDEFYQVKNPERDRKKGFGLGLYAVSQLAKLLGTKIEVQSIVGKGSVFSINLPLGYSNYQVNDASDGQEKNNTNTMLSEKVVLVVDDDEIVLSSLTALIQSWSADVFPETSYRSAINFIEKEKIIPDLIIADYRLPEHRSGIQLADAIRERYRIKIPVIILTGDTEKSSLTEIIESKYDFIHKPAKANKLQDMIAKLLKL